MHKNLSWLVAFLFFAVAVIVMLAPEKRSNRPPLMNWKEFETIAWTVFPSGSVSLAGGKGQSGGGDHYAYHLDFQPNSGVEVQPNLDDFEAYMKSLATFKGTMKSIGGDVHRRKLKSDQLYVELSAIDLENGTIQVRYLEVQR